MGIYYCVIDSQAKKRFEPPRDFSIKEPGIFHPTNPFPNMVMMMNSFGYNFRLCNDTGDEEYYRNDCEDITDEVYEKYLSYFPWAKDEIYEPKEN